MSNVTTCRTCDGEGIVHTGIGEASTTICNKCDGTGNIPATPSSANGAEGLPEPALRTDMHYEGRGRPAYSVEQLRAAVLAERLACAEACMRASPNRAKVKAIGESAHYVACAETIRART